MLRSPALVLLLCSVASAGETPTARSTVWWGDYDSDGLDDAWVVQPDGAGHLLRNNGLGSFADVTERAGLAGVAGVHMAVWGDANSDGRVDLYLPAWHGPSRLFVQLADGTFTDHTEDAALPLHADPLEATWRDVDGDGHLDLHLVTELDDLVYRNDGDGRFEKLDLGLTPRAVVGARPVTFQAARASRGLPAGRTGAGAGAGGPSGPTFDVMCAIGVNDQAFPANCLNASTVPTLGMLYPLSNDWYVDAASGFTGLGTTTPAHRLDVVGNVRATGKLISTTSGAPLQVSSTTKVSNLNADLLDGLESSAFAQLPISGADVLDGTLTSDDLANASVGSAEIANGSVSANDLGSNSVGSSELQTDSVGGLELQNGAVSDIHVDNLAAIQGTKIVPNFGAQVIATTSGVFAMEVEASAVVDSGFGSATSPSFRFAAGEATGLSSPFSNYLYLLTDGVARLRIAQDGSVNIGQGSWWAHMVSNCYTDQPAPPGKAGAAIYGLCDATTGETNGVLGTSYSEQNGAGVQGRSNATTGAGYGVFGKTINDFGAGVYGVSTALNGEGVQGYCMEDGGTGVWAQGQTWGVRSRAPELGGTGVWGWGLSTMGFCDGVKGEAEHTNSYGVWGVNNAAGGTGVACSGNLTATGTKFFVQPHPQDAEKVVRFVCLEGNEAGTYFRGSSATVDGAMTIPVPDVFRMVSDPEQITVQVTPRGPATLWVESADLERVVVRGTADVEFDYFVNGVRRGYQDLEILAENRLYRPTERGVPYGAGLPDEVRRMLVDNGTLNDDFTPNEATATRLGWELKEPGWREAQHEEARILGEQRQGEIVRAQPAETSRSGK